MLCGQVTTVYVCVTSGSAACVRSPLSVIALTASTQCAATDFIAMTSAEFISNTSSPFHLTLAEGAALSGAILAVWGVAYMFRVLPRIFNSGSPENT